MKLSHDYLVKHIEAWIEESEREVTKVLEVIDRAYEAYQSTNLLLENSALQMIKPYEDQLVLPTEKQAFVNRSKTQVRKKRRGLLLKVGVALLAVALVVGGIFGYQIYQAYQETSKANVELERQKDEAENARKDAEQQAQIAQEARMKAERQARIAQARQLAVEAQAVLEEFPQRSLLLAVEALNVTLREGEPRIPAAEQVLRDALANTGGIGLSGGVIAISPDGHWLATGNTDGTVRLWDLSAKDPAATPLVLRGHEGNIETVAFGPDNHWLVTGSAEHTARLWNLTATNPAATPLILRGHESAINTVAFSPDNHWLVTGSKDGTARLWTLQLDELIKRACLTAGRNLSYTEWNQYFRGEEYRKTCPDLPIHPGVIIAAQAIFC